MRSRLAVILTVLVFAFASVGFGLVAFTAPPVTANHVSSIGGVAVLPDVLPLPVVDLSDGLGSSTLAEVFKDVGATNYSQVQPLQVGDGYLLLNRLTGSFNYLQAGNLIADPSGQGIGLGSAKGVVAARAYSTGGNAYIVRFYRSSESIYLINPDIVAKANSETRFTLHPLGFATLRGHVVDPLTQVVATGGGLWLLTADRSHNTYSLYSAALPVKSHGALRVGFHGRVDGPAVLEATGSLGSRPLAVVASRASLEGFTKNGLKVFESSLSTRSGLGVGSSVSDALAVSNAAGAPWFLVESQSGAWYLVGDRAETSAGTVVTKVKAAFPPQFQGFIRPAYESGFLYTMELTAGRSSPIVRVNVDNGQISPVPGASVYPLKRSEAPSMALVTVQAFQGRIIYNSPESLLSLVVFTEGKGSPQILDKAVLPTLDPNAPSGALVRQAKSKPKVSSAVDHKTPPPASKSPQTTAPIQLQAVTTAIDCATASEKPNIAQITSVVPGPQSATVSWSYPLLDAQSCEPSTYEVSITPLDGAPTPAAPSIQVNGQTNTVLTGLKSSSTYQVVVTAFIGSSSTASLPATFTTTAEGADAPLSVSSTFVPGVGWQVSWTACQASACNVTAASWNVLAVSCAGSFIGTPPSVSVSAPTQSALIPLSDALVGQSLGFSVDGVSATGLVGNSTSSHTCQEGVRAPTVSELSFNASEVASSGATTTQAQLSIVPIPGASMLQALGSSAVDYSFCVAKSPGGSCVAGEGPSSDSSATLSGLSPGTAYYATARVIPVGYPALAVSLKDSAPLSATVPWSAVTFAVSSFTVSQIDPNSGTLTFNVSSSYPAPLAVDVTPVVTCGSVSVQIGSSPSSLTLAAASTSGPGVVPLLYPNVPLSSWTSGCSVKFGVTTTQTPDPFVTASTTSSLVTNAMMPTNAPKLSPTFTAYLEGADFTKPAAASCTPTTTPSSAAYLVICEAQSSPGFSAPWGSWSVTSAELDVASSKCTVSTLPNDVSAESDVMDVSSCFPSGTASGSSVTGQIVLSWSYLGPSVALPYVDVAATVVTSSTTNTTVSITSAGVVSVTVGVGNSKSPVSGGSFTLTSGGSDVSGCSDVSFSGGTGTCTTSNPPSPGVYTATYIPPSLVYQGSTGSFTVLTTSTTTTSSSTTTTAPSTATG
ncbi:MAG: fibronectin type III domain-containing protein [Ferrimicrobium sp.]